MSALPLRARLAAAVLLVLAGGAVLAPWLANERPLALRAVDRAGYAAALRGQAAVAGQLARRLREGASSPHVEAERRALAGRLAVLRRYLPEDPTSPRTPLDGIVGASDRAGAVARARGASAAEREAAAAELEDEARALRARLDPDAPGGPGAPGGPALRARWSFPALATTAGGEVALMVLWLAAALAFLGVPPRAALGGGAAAAVLAGLLWSALVHDPAAARGPSVKRALSDGGLVAEVAVFPPLAMGYAETNFSEALRPPTWSAAAEIDDAGHYVRGDRAPDPATPAHLRAPPRPVEVRAAEPPRNAALRHPLGTDALGRDVLARLLHGGRVSLAVGLLAALLLTVVGVAVGALAGSAGGKVDAVLLRGIEVVDAIPTLFLVLFASALVPATGGVHPMLVVAALIALAGWTGVARLVRGEFLRLRPLEFVEAARVLGFSRTRVALRHVLPNALGPVWVAAAFAVSSAILLESAVSFLGFGVQVPVPSWGAVLGDAQDLAEWWLFVFPGLLILATVLCTNALGEAARAALDPRETPALLDPGVAGPVRPGGTR